MEPSRQAPYLRLHQPGSLCLPQTGDSLRPCPTQLLGQLKCFPWLFRMNGFSLPMIQIFLNYVKQVAPGLSEPCTSCYIAPGLALAAACLGSQLGLTCAPPSSAQEAAICRSLCSLCCMTLDRTQAVADLGYANSNQGSTTRGGCIQPHSRCISSTQLG